MKKLIAISIFLFHTVCINKSFAQVPTNQQQRQKNIEADNVLLNAFSTGDVRNLDAVIAADFLNHAGTDKVGLDSLKAMIKGFHQRVPNVKMEVIRQFADEEHVSDWVRFSGSNGTVIEGMEVTRYANGKASEHWFFVNNHRPQQIPKKYQAKAPPTQPFGKEAFGSSKETTVRWMGMGGFLINSRGTTIMVDPLSNLVAFVKYSLAFSI